MTDNKKSFVFYKEWRDAIQDLPNDVRLEFYESIMEYAFTGEFKGLKPLVNIAFNFVKTRIDKDREEYSEKCKRLQQNGQKGGAPKGNSNALKKNNQMVEKTTKTTKWLKKQPKQPDGCKNNQNNQIEGDNVYDYDYVYDYNYKEKDIPKGISKKKAEADASPASENYLKLIEWIDLNAPLTNKMQFPLTAEQVDKLYDDYNDGIIKETLLAMHNWKDLRKKNTSTYLTLRKWISKDLKNGNNGKNKRNIINTNAKFQTSKDLED